MKIPVTFGPNESRLVDATKLVCQPGSAREVSLLSMVKSERRETIVIDGFVATIPSWVELLADIAREHEREHLLLALYRAKRSVDGGGLREGVRGAGDLPPRTWSGGMHLNADKAIERIERRITMPHDPTDRTEAYIEAVRRWGPRADVRVHGDVFLVGIYPMPSSLERVDSLGMVLEPLGRGRTFDEAFAVADGGTPGAPSSTP